MNKMEIDIAHQKFSGIEIIKKAYLWRSVWFVTTKANLQIKTP